MRDLIPPHNTEAEESLLGGILSDYNSVIDLILSINVSDFHSDRCACIFSGILELHNEGERVNIVTVIEKLRQKNGLEEAGGAYYITGLNDSSPSSANLKSYINVVKELARKRKLLILGREIEDKAGSREDSEDIISHISGKIYDIDSSSDANLIYGSEILKRRREGLIERIKGCVIGTNYPSIDEKLGSGFAPKQGSIICGRPGIGKSAYKENLINNQCQQGYKILSIIPEMGFDAEMDRHTSILTGLPLMDILHMRDWVSVEDGKFKTKNKEKLRQIRKATKTISEWNLYFLDGHVSLSDTYRRIIEVKRKYGLDIVYIDLFDRIEEVDLEIAHKPQVIGKCLNFYERIQKEQNIHICKLVQISRKIENRKDKRPTMSDLKESGSFEEKAWMIMGMYRESMYNKDCFDDTIEMIMLKQKTGSYFSQKLNWDPETLYISEDNINTPF